MTDAPAPADRTTAALWLGLLALSAAFVVLEVRQAAALPFSGDEGVGLVDHMRPVSYGELLLRGAPNESSPAPLFHLAQKALDAAGASVGYLGLGPNVYLRLVSMTATLLLGLAACALLWSVLRRRGLADGQAALLVLFVLAAFLFQTRVFHYASRMRAYALWNSLTFASLVVLALVPRARVRLVVLSLLAFSASASAFQIVAFAAAWFATTRSRRPADLASFALPLVIASWYALRTRHDWGFAGEEFGTWSRFLGFWALRAAPLWFCAGAAYLLARRHEALRPAAVAPLSLLLLMALGPLIYWVTRERNFFFTPRQYLYYGLATPVLVMVLALGRREIRIRPAWIVAACALVIGVQSYDTVKRIRPALGPMSGPAVDRLGLLRDRAPRTLAHPPGLTYDRALNVQFLREWLASRSPGPGEGCVHLEGDGETVAAVATGEPPPGWIVIPVHPGR